MIRTILIIGLGLFVATFAGCNKEDAGTQNPGHSVNAGTSNVRGDEGSVPASHAPTHTKTVDFDPFKIQRPELTERRPIVPLPPDLETTTFVPKDEQPGFEIPEIPDPDAVAASGQQGELVQLNKPVLDPVPNDYHLADFASQPNLAPPPGAEIEYFEDDDTEHERPVIIFSDTAAKDESYDPIKANGQYFVDWPKPELALVFTGQMNGYLEPCGCAGMAQMKGGLSRRKTFLDELQAKKWPLVTIDGGNLCKGSGRQEELKFHLASGALQGMQYDAVGLGKNELKFSVTDLLSVTLNMENNPSMFTSSNIAMFEFNPEWTAPYKIIAQNNYRIGITSVIADSVLKELNNPEIATAAAGTKLAETLRQMKAQIALEENNLRKAGKLAQGAVLPKVFVLIVDGSLAETEALGKAYPDFKILVPSESPSDPPIHVPKFVNTVYAEDKSTVIDAQYLMEVGEKGKFAVVLGFFNDPEFPVRYQRVAFDSRYKNSPVVIKLMEQYQQQLKKEGFAGLGIKEILNPQSKELGSYIGSQKCESCHAGEYETWKETRHSHAWYSLTDISNPPRNFDPECIACHVVGWEPTSLLPYEGGYQSEAKTRHLLNVGCESCHGPGEVHAKLEAPGGGAKADMEKVRKMIRPAMDTLEKSCIKCHDLDNSPGFDFKTYWPKVKHTLE